MKTVFLFDFGGVICLPQQPGPVRAMQELCGLDAAEFSRRYFADRPEFDRGTLKPHPYWETVCGRSLTHTQVAQLLQMDIQSWTSPNQHTLGVLQNLHRRGAPLLLLSNLNEDFKQAVLDNFDWPRLFDHRVFSCDVGLIKPDPAIFWHALALLRAKPDQAVFFDDHPANVAAAAALGIEAVLVDRETAVAEWLERQKAAE